MFLPLEICSHQFTCPERPVDEKFDCVAAWSRFSTGILHFSENGVGVQQEFLTFRKRQWVYRGSPSLFKKNRGCSIRVLHFFEKGEGVHRKFFPSRQELSLAPIADVPAPIGHAIAAFGPFKSCYWHATLESDYSQEEIH